MRPCLDHLTCVLRDYDAERASVAAQPGVAADRFAREIGPFLKLSSAARSRQLNAIPLDGTHSLSSHLRT